VILVADHCGEWAAMWFVVHNLPVAAPLFIKNEKLPSDQPLNEQEIKSLLKLHSESAIVSSENDKLNNFYPPRQTCHEISRNSALSLTKY